MRGWQYLPLERGLGARRLGLDPREVAEDRLELPGEAVRQRQRRLGTGLGRRGAKT